PRFLAEFMRRNGVPLVVPDPDTADRSFCPTFLEFAKGVPKPAYSIAGFFTVWRQESHEIPSTILLSFTNLTLRPVQPRFRFHMLDFNMDLFFPFAQQDVCFPPFIVSIWPLADMPSHCGEMLFQLLA